MRAATTIARTATWVTWPLTRLDRNGALSRPVVLCYHRVLPRAAGFPYPRYAVSPRQFREQMALLAAEGFHSLTLAEFSAIASGTRELPSRSVLVTFDDGFADIYLNAWPIARDFGIALNVFLCTGLMSGAHVAGLDESSGAVRPLTWGEVREMRAAGVGFGFHSHGHQNHGRLGLEEIAADAQSGLTLLKGELGVRPAAFAFPYGHFGSYSTAAISVLKQQGLEIFFTTEMDATALPSTAPISRLVIHPDDDLRSFRRKLYGGYEWVGKLRRLGYSLRVTGRTGAGISSPA